MVFAVVSDPVGAGFVQNLAHPGGNATGFVNIEGSIGGKWLEKFSSKSHQARRAFSFVQSEYLASIILLSKIARGGGPSLDSHCHGRRHN